MSVAAKKLQGRSGLTLVEMLVTLAIIGTFMTLLSFHLVGLSNIWLNRTDDDFFEQHVDGVVLFLNNALEASEGASGQQQGEASPPVGWARPPGCSDIDDPLPYFQQAEAPALPAIQAYIYFDDREGLSILWFSAFDAEDIEQTSDLRRTPVSSYVTQVDYAYYELEDDEWEITDEPMEDDGGAFRLPDFLRLTFTHPEEGERTRSVFIPHASTEIPLF